MKILAFDTCLNKTYVTLSEGNEILISKTISNKEEKYHSAFLISTIVSILKQFNIMIKDIDVFGVNIGPGSFTGIRACITVARVFAQQTNKPLVGVSSLEILSRINTSDKNSLVLLDARRQQLYAASYDKNGKELSAPRLLPIDELDTLNLKDSCIICDDFSKKIIEEKNLTALDYNLQDTNLGLLLNELVNEKINNGNDWFWAKLKPLYLQTPPVSCKCAPAKSV